MAWTRRQVFAVLSTLYLVALTGIGAFSLHKIRVHSLPIPHVLAAFTLALPAIAGLALETLTLSSLRTKSSVFQQSRFSQLSILLLFIVETVLATLAGTYITPANNLRCALDGRWQSLFSARNRKAIRRIQDAFECCGLHSPVDRAYPFPAKDVAVNACMKAYGRQKSCFTDWLGEERSIAGCILGVVLAVALWQILIILMPSENTSEFGEEDAENQTNDQRALDYPSGERRYLDNPVTEETDGNDGNENAALVSGDQENWASERPGN